jgi:aspartate carbamoyltransferase catalytic subunit
MAYLKGKNILSTADLSKSEIEQILDVSAQMLPIARKEKQSNELVGKVLASLFYEPSTRTRLSFETAMNRLGGRVISVTGTESSSLSKGETLSDTARVISQFADIVAIRHAEIGSANEFAGAASVPVINAGDGAGEHPTQALLDIFTILQERGDINGLTIALVGDLKYGRTVHSLSYLLKHYGVKLIYVSPEQLAMPKEILQQISESGIAYTETEKMDEALKHADVIYMTRVQKERFSDPAEYEKYKNYYVLTKEMIEKHNAKITVMHPLPRVGEISLNVDELSGAAYFRQVQNGVAVRMALLKLLIG